MSTLLLNVCTKAIKNASVEDFYDVESNIHAGLIIVFALGERVDLNQRKEFITVVNHKLAECRLTSLNAEMISGVNCIQRIVNKYSGGV